MLGIAALALLPLALGQNVPLPATGDNGKVGGIFGLAGGAPGKGAGAPSLAGLTTKGKESPTTTKRVRDFGSGKYKAKYFADPSLPNHTIYAPKVAPIGVKLPVLVWGNGACMNTGTLFYDFLVEIASHGYLVVANGPPGKDVVEDGEVNIEPSAGLLGAQGSGQSKPSQLTESVHWVVKGGAAKYGDIDTAKIAAAGQSCGGLEAYSASYHDDRVKLTMLFNSGVISEDQKKLLKELKAPVGYFLGGPKDAAYANGANDYTRLPDRLPAMLASLDSGHFGTFGSTHGGKSAIAAVAFLDWQFRGDAKAKLRFDQNSAESLVKDNWNITQKNF